MRQTHAVDDRAIVMISGLRLVAKSDHVRVTQDGSEGSYFLELNYKGADKRIVYNNSAERDAMFDQIVGLLPKSTRDR